MLAQQIVGLDDHPQHVDPLLAQGGHGRGLGHRAQLDHDERSIARPGVVADLADEALEDGAGPGMGAHEPDR